MTRPMRQLPLALLAGLALSAAAGCRQKMADQPYYRPLEPSEFFEDGRASRPLERGVVHRAQRLESDPLVTGLTADEWSRSYTFGLPSVFGATSDAKGKDGKGDPKGNGKGDAKLSDEDRTARAIGAPRYLPTDAANKVYADAYPLAITNADLKRGQDRYTYYCAVCHGALGNGMGKIRERGYLQPTSFHTSVLNDDEREQRARDEQQNKNDPPGEIGISRGYRTYGHRVPMAEAPVGYYFEVITKGYGGMGSYSAQIPPADRWRIVAYIRLLQESQTGTGGKK